MYAVREEVDVLKEQIKELRDTNTQLEYENNILKNAASPETLAKLAAAGGGGSKPTTTHSQPPTSTS